MTAMQEKMQHHLQAGTSPTEITPELFITQITPEAFIKCWEKWRVVDDATWDACPIHMGCKTCGKTDSQLMRCGKCGVVRYCSKECQASDWKMHKKACFKA